VLLVDTFILGGKIMQHNYEHPELLVETQWLEDHLGDEGLRIVDCDSPDAYRRVHIPGSVNVGENSNVKGEDGVHVMQPEPLALFMGNLGITSDTLVVAYDSRNSLQAARFWWVLNYYGHTNVKVLNGGWRKWLYEGRPVTEGIPNITPTTFAPRPDPSLLVTGEELRSLVGESGPVIWDVRSEAEHTGENIRSNKYGGHIPGAVSMEWNSVVDDNKFGAFKPASEIRSMLESKGITPEKETYAY